MAKTTTAETKKPKTPKKLDITPKEDSQAKTQAAPQDTFVPSTNNKELIEFVDGRAIDEAYKQKVVQILSPVFSQLSHWKSQIESIEVKDANDKLAMDTASEARKIVKSERIKLGKAVESEMQLVKDDMKPFHDKLDAWKHIFQFVEGMCKSIEGIALEKEKTVERLKAEELSRIREIRLKETEHLHAFLPPMYDIATMTPEQYDAVVKTAKLALSADKANKEQERIENEKKELEAQNLRLLNDRKNKLSQLGFRHVDAEGNIPTRYYSDRLFLGFTDEEITTHKDEFWEELIGNLYLDLKAFEEKELRDKEAKEIEDKQMAEKRRAELIRRTGLFLDVKLLNDAMYWERGKDDLVFVCKYEPLYQMSPTDLDAMVKEHNKKAENHRFDVADRLEKQKQADIKAAEDKARQEEQDRQKRQKEKEDKEKADKIAEEERLKAQASDKDKIKRISDQLYDIYKTRPELKDKGLSDIFEAQMKLVDKVVIELDKLSK